MVEKASAADLQSIDAFSLKGGVCPEFQFKWRPSCDEQNIAYGQHFPTAESARKPHARTTYSQTCRLVVHRPLLVCCFQPCLVVVLVTVDVVDVSEVVDDVVVVMVEVAVVELVTVLVAEVLVVLVAVVDDVVDVRVEVVSVVVADVVVAVVVVVDVVVAVVDDLGAFACRVRKSSMPKPQGCEHTHNTYCGP